MCRRRLLSRFMLVAPALRLKTLHKKIKTIVKILTRHALKHANETAPCAGRKFFIASHKFNYYPRALLKCSAIAKARRV
jgi:hypothetical protein